MSTKKWSEEAWEAAAPIYNAILELPFIKEMAEGTLSSETFTRYIEQDNLYINDYCKVLAHIASRLTDIDDINTFLGFAGDGVQVEKALHSMYVSNGTSEKSPACQFYTSLLKSQAYENVAVEAAAILPCFWVYLRVGKHIFNTCKMEGNPYADWIKCYSDPAFDVSNDKAIALCDKLANSATEETRRKMTAIFVECTRQEWLFWHSAYADIKWNNIIK